MASPLSPLQNANLNSIPTPQTSQKLCYDSYEVIHTSSVTTTHPLADRENGNCSDGAASTAGSDKEHASRTLQDTMDVAGTTSAAASPRANDVDHQQQHSSSSQENMSPNHTAKPIPPAVVTSTITNAKPARPGSRILSGSELSPLKILQGRVTGGPPSSSAASTATAGSPASPDSSAESRRDCGDDQASSTASSPPPSLPPQRTLSSSSTQMLPPAVPLGRTPRKITSPEKRFPVKISVPLAATMAAAAAAGPKSPKQQEQPQPSQQQQQQPPTSPKSQALFEHIQKQQQPLHGRQMSLDEAIQLNEGLKHAIEIFEDETSEFENGIGADSEDPNNTHKPQHQRQGSLTNGRGHSVEDFAARDDDLAGVDDTMVSTFSTFSAVPNMAMLSRLGGNTVNSPNKLVASNGPGPDMAALRTPRANGHGAVNGGPLPNRTAHYESGNTTNLLMDLTEQLRFAHGQQQSPSRGPGVSSPDANGAAAATPRRKSLVNLLDFEIPPLPTPRSIPTVTPRELESLKSNYLSEISSLKASLSGKEAEVLALKTAIGDAEKRVGVCMEQLREESGSRAQLAEEKDQWERRGREMEEVLRKVKAEIVLGQREREELEAKLDESEKRREAAEMMAQEAETKMAVMRAGRATAEAENNKTRSPGGSSAPSAGSSGSVQREVEIAVERVARELHAAYKAKHETKVTALKKSYEARWEKRVRELEAAAETLAEENEKLKVGRDATLTKLLAGDEEERRAEEARRQREAQDAAQIKELGAEVEKLEAVVRTVKADNAELRTLLEQERVEKGELVILAEEMMSMQQQQSFIAAAVPAAPPPAPAAPASPRKPKTPARTSISTSNGFIGGPGSTQSSSRNSMVAPSAGTAATTTPGRARPMSMHGTGSRISGLKPPSSSVMTTGAAPSRIGRLGHDRKQGSTGGIPRPGSGLGMRSGLMSSIEKMGNYRGRAE